MNPQQREAIDSARPGVDLAQGELRLLSEQLAGDAELRRALERSHRLDESIGRAFRARPVPSGLAERILARLGEDSSTAAFESVQADAALPVSAEAVTLLEKSSPGGVTRRRFWTYAAAAAACLAVLAVGLGVSAFFAWQPQPPVPLEQLAEESQHWIDKANAGVWRDGGAPLPADHLPHDDVKLPVVRWQRMETEYDGNAVAYDLTPPGKRGVWMFVLQTDQRFDRVTTLLPESPAWTSGNFAIGACQRGGLLYVLVVEGDARRYESFIKYRPPLT